MTQVKVVCADDALDFERQLNDELALMDDTFIEMVAFDSKEWAFCAILMYEYK